MPNSRQPAKADAGFETSLNTGAVSTIGTSAQWNVGFNLSGQFPTISFDQRSTGFRLLGGDSAEITVVCPAPGVLIGSTPNQTLPELFSTDLNFYEEENRSWLEIDGRYVYLFQDAQEAGRRFVLLTQGTDLETLELAARQWLQTADPIFLWGEETERRASWSQEVPDYAHNPQTQQCLELLDARIMQAEGIFQGDWIRSDHHLDRAFFPLRSILPVLPELQGIAPDTVESVLATVCSVQQEDGSIPAQVWPDGSGTEAPMWPVLALCVQRIIGQSAPPEQLARAIENSLGFWIGRQDLAAGEIPVWPDAEDCLTPEVFDPDSLLADLPVLLLAECEAATALGIQSKELTEAANQLRQLIQERFVQRDESRIMDLTPDGSHAKRQTASSLVTCISPSLRETSLPPLFKDIRGAKGLFSEFGMQQWETWQQDEETAPIRAELQLLIAQFLSTHAPDDIQTLVSGSWVRTLKSMQKNRLGLPGEWTQSGQSDEAHSWSVYTAALALVLNSVREEVDLTLGDYSPTVRFLERHRHMVVGGFTGVLSLCVLALVIYYAMLPSLTMREQVTRSGVAESMYNMGEYEKARNQLIDIIKRSQHKRFNVRYHFQLGKAEYQLGNTEQAMIQFQKTVEMDEKNKHYPQALWNLAQANRALGNRDKATELFERYITLHGDEHPQQAELARTAIYLMQKPTRTIKDTLQEK